MSLRRLDDCGHRCLAKCHSDALHHAFKCPQPCERLLSFCGHNCPKACGDPCGRCNVEICETTLPCGHVKERLFCHQTVDLSKVRCDVPVEKTVPGCHHVVTVPCSEDVSPSLFKCPTPCLAILSCGHQCPGSCSRCHIEANGAGLRYSKHQECQKKCERRHGTCNHVCLKRCHGSQDCGLCDASCEVNIPDFCGIGGITIVPQIDLGGER